MNMNIVPHSLVYRVIGCWLAVHSSLLYGALPDGATINNTPTAIASQISNDTQPEANDSAPYSAIIDNAALTDTDTTECFQALLEQHYQTALRACQASAEQGNGADQYNLAMMYQAGQGTKQNLQQALYWYQKAALQGVPNAQYDLGVLFDQGSEALNIAPNPEQAFRWYQKAAENGNINAQFNLAGAYLQGIGVESDPQTALKWYQKAAQNGDSGAQYNLGVMHVEGIGTPLDFIEAYAWLKNVNRLSQHAELTELLNSLAAQLSKDDFKTAEDRARLYGREFPIKSMGSELQNAPNN